MSFIRHATEKGSLRNSPIVQGGGEKGKKRRRTKNGVEADRRAEKKGICGVIREGREKGKEMKLGVSWRDPRKKERGGEASKQTPRVRGSPPSAGGGRPSGGRKEGRIDANASTFTREGGREKGRNATDAKKGGGGKYIYLLTGFAGRSYDNYFPNRWYARKGPSLITKKRTGR